MTPEALALITLITAKLKAKGYRYLAEVENEDDEERRVIVVRIYKGLDEA